MSDKRCICDDGFGLNLSCPLHQPWGREMYEAMQRRGWKPAVRDGLASVPPREEG